MPGTRGLGAVRERNKACKTMSSQMPRTWARMVRGKEPRAAKVPEPAPRSTTSRDKLTAGTGCANGWCPEALQKVKDW